MKKTLTLLSGAIFLLMSLAYMLMVMRLDHATILNEVKNSIADAGYEATTTSVGIKHFPLPRILIGNLSIQSLDSNNQSAIRSENVSISISIPSLLTFKPAIGSIVSSRSTITSIDPTITNHEVLLQQLHKILSLMPDVHLNNIELRSLNSSRSGHIDAIDLKPHASFNNIILHWDKSTQTNISFSEQAAPFTAMITTLSPNHKVELSETYDGQGRLVSGHLDYKIHNLKDYIETTYPDIPLLVTNVSSTENVSITSDLECNRESILLKNIAVTSHSIQASGEATLFTDDRPAIINLAITSMNLNSLVSDLVMASARNTKYKDQLATYNLHSQINLTAQDILLKDITIKGLNLEVLNSQDKATVKDLSFTTLDGGRFNASGIVTKNQYRAKFDGKVVVTHPDTNSVLSKLGFNNATTNGSYPLHLKADVAASPIDYQLNNLLAKIGLFEVEGNMAVKLIGNTPRIGLTLDILPIDLSSNDYPILSPALNYFFSLTQKMQDNDYANKYIPLRKVSYIGNFDLTLSQPYIKHHQLNKIHLVTDVSAGNIDASTIYYQDGGNYLRGAARLTTSSLKPTLDILTVEGSLSTPSFSLDDLLNTLALSYSKYAFNKVGLNFNINLNYLNIGNLALNNVTLATNNTDNALWKISNLNASYNTGKFTSSGSLLIDSLTLNLAYAYNNFKIRDLDILYPTTLFGIKDGWASANGTIVTTGNNSAQWVYNMSVSSAFVARDVTHSNFNIDGFAAATDSASYNATNLNDDIKNYMSSGELSISNASGKYELEHGVLRFSDVVFQTKRSSGALSALYNLYNSSIDAKTDFAYIPVSLDPYSGQKPLHVKVHVTDNIISPKLDIDSSEVKSMLDARTKSPYYQQSNPIPKKNE